ncbi:class I SAM-dependent methyltransferase [Paenibacillus donghaensis]|uniref:class I SAM-dependent methyltransferase n=1 Tax=Paenibacillus donghaensis TaxID=414771 RepID=UPI00188365F8|nr:class I SAM-dependent methyltransferase [Paenibacillus donghaensis]MBE9915773.1 class I SAM-dependent methyltransferase [Paenibacillus donghaensis]
MIITTGDKAGEAIIRRAEELASRTGSRYVPRRHTPLSKMSKLHGNAEIIVVLDGGARLVRPGENPLEFHPSMGFIRAKRILKGESDPMLDAACMQEGDTVLDCTAGLGTDALVFAVKGGRNTKVMAAESSAALAALLSEGLAYYTSAVEEVNEALRRVEILNRDHLEVLRSLPDRSVDIVYFDPMFREPLMDSSAIRPLRWFANSEALSKESIQEAVRVARKTVVLKEKRGSREFARLGFSEQERAHSKISYGVITVDRNEHSRT